MNFLTLTFQDGRPVGGKRLAATSEEENLEEAEADELERPEAKKRKNSES